MILREQDNKRIGKLWKFDDKTHHNYLGMTLEYKDKTSNTRIFTDISKDEAIKIAAHLRDVFGLEG